VSVNFVAQEIQKENSKGFQRFKSLQFKDDSFSLILFKMPTHVLFLDVDRDAKGDYQDH